MAGERGLVVEVVVVVVVRGLACCHAEGWLYPGRRLLLFSLRLLADTLAT